MTDIVKNSVTFEDGTVIPLPDVETDYQWSLKVVLDGKVLDVALAYRALLAYRQWSAAKIDALKTELADYKAHRDRCPLAQKEAEDAE